jgi:hypothetical protein
VKLGGVIGSFNLNNAIGVLVAKLLLGLERAD